jgi:hypothetical protein
MHNSALTVDVDATSLGRKVALWLFGLIVSVKIAQTLAVLLGGESVAVSADGIPLDTYAPAAAQTVVSLWTLLAVTKLWIYLLCVLALIRYRAFIPLMFGVLLLNDLGKYVVLQFLPIARVGAPPGPAVNLVLLALTVVGLALSLWQRNARTAQSP